MEKGMTQVHPSQVTDIHGNLNAYIGDLYNNQDGISQYSSPSKKHIDSETYLKKYSKTPGKSKMPKPGNKMEVGNGVVALASEKFQIEKKILDYKKQKMEKYKEQKRRHQSVTVNHRAKVNTTLVSPDRTSPLR